MMKKAKIRILSKDEFFIVAGRDVTVKMKQTLWRWIGAIAAVIMIGGCGMQQEELIPKTKYPTKSITLIVPGGAGGGLDLQARTLQKYLTQKLGQNVIVENKPGSGGVTGCNEMINQAADGYTLGFVGVGNLLQPLYGKSKYDYLTALDPLAQVSESSSVLAVSAAQPWKNMQELTEYAKAHPAELKFGHSGLGDTAYLIGSSIMVASKVKWDPVPFNSAAEAVAALLGDHVQIVISNPAVMKELMKEGKLRVLATSGEKRMKDPDFAAIPTLKEQNVDVAFTVWRNIVAHKPLPREVKAKLETALYEAIHDPEFIQYMENMGLEVNYLNAEECTDRWIKDGNKLKKFLKETGIADQIKEQRQ